MAIEKGLNIINAGVLMAGLFVCQVMNRKKRSTLNNVEAGIINGTNTRTKRIPIQG